MAIITVEHLAFVKVCILNMERQCETTNIRQTGREVGRETLSDCDPFKGKKKWSRKLKQ